VAIIDISLKTGNGIDLIKRIKARGSNVRMLVWSMYDESLYAERAIRAGAMGYISKGNATEKIVEAIHRVLDGKLYLSEPTAEQILSRALGNPGKKVDTLPVETLSDRELEVFQLIGQGLDTVRVAEKMRVSPKTVETYRARIKEKLSLANATELIQRAVKWMMEKT
jgi:DNA-binding NarL/FixJ family response regulator